jgi:hypothetical protein
VPRACSRSTPARSHCALYHIHHPLRVVVLGEAKMPERLFKRHVLAGQHQSGGADSEKAAAVSSSHLMRLSRPFPSTATPDDSRLLSIDQVGRLQCLAAGGLSPLCHLI